MKRNISGRSMIEMLGVLAIIGVLSAGGIMGYSTAMESHKVNKFMEMASYSAAMIQADLPDLQGQQTIYAEDLCDLKVISPDICDAVNPEWEEDFRKGYFGEKLFIYFSDDFSNNSYDITYADGTTGQYSSPYRHLAIRIESEIPKTACMKIVTNQGWLKIGDLVATSPSDKLGSLGNTELPLSIETAETACTEELTGDVDFRINVMVHLSKIE